MHIDILKRSTISFTSSSENSLPSRRPHASCFGCTPNGKHIIEADGYIYRVLPLAVALEYIPGKKIEFIFTQMIS